MVMCFGKYILLLISLLGLMSMASTLRAQTCTYSTWSWNVNLKKAVLYRTVRKSYPQLTVKEIDVQTGCSVCKEDQVAIKLPGIKPFLMCRQLALRVKSTLSELLNQGQLIKEVIGYRVGQTRGKLDAHGNRTGFSNHSFGIALDINPQSNGLYTRCFRFGDQCRLLRGGKWQPGKDPRSLKANGLIVRQLKRIGFKWGGEIKGRQKDFMHFSITGY